MLSVTTVVVPVLYAIGASYTNVSSMVMISSQESVARFTLAAGGGSAEVTSRDNAPVLPTVSSPIDTTRAISAVLLGLGVRTLRKHQQSVISNG